MAPLVASPRASTRANDIQISRPSLRAASTQGSGRSRGGTPGGRSEWRGTRGQLFVDRLFALAVGGVERAQPLRERVHRRVRLAHVVARLVLEHGVGAVHESVVERGDLLCLAVRVRLL